MEGLFGSSNWLYIVQGTSYFATTSPELGLHLGAQLLETANNITLPI